MKNLSRYVIGITTVDRKERDSSKKNYIQQTVENLIAVGALDYQDTQLIVSDSGSKSEEYLQFLYPLSEKYNGRIHLLHAKRKLTANENVAKVIRYASEYSSEYVMYTQDDAIYRPTLMPNVDHFVKKYPSHPIWSFHAVYEEVLRNARKGKDYYRYPYGDFYGSICYVMRREISARWANHLQWIYENQSDPIGADMYLGRWLKREFPSQNIAQSCPCFAQHVGRSSVICAGDRPITNQSFNPFFLKPECKKYYEMVEDIDWNRGEFTWK